MGKRIVMSVDRTMASDYRGTAYFGFTACLPRKFLPEWLYFRLVAPSAGADEHGALAVADCGSRKVEAGLRREGWGDDQLIYAHPDRLDRAVGPETRVFLFGSHDPLGRGPLTSMLSHLVGRGHDAYNASAVRRMLEHPAIRRHKPVVIAGGAGAWEFAVDEEARRRLGVDCVLVGEAERTLPGLVRKALAGEPLPAVIHGQTVPVDEIPGLTAPTVNGVQEITRGCGRGCDFCVPNLQSLRSIPVDRVCADAEINAAANDGRVVFHAEDVFRYEALPGYRVNHDAICKLFDTVSGIAGVRSVGVSHGTLTGVVSSPETIRELADIRRRHATGPLNAFGMQMGVETGSRELARRHLAAKMRPFHPEDWPEVVREGAKLLHENGFFACFTLIFGLPGETEDDVRETLALVRDLDGYPSTIVPLFYVPMGVSRSSRKEVPFSFDRMTRAHFELLQVAWDHNYRYMDRIWQQYGREDQRLLKRIVHAAVRGGTRYLRRRLRRFTGRHGAASDPWRDLPVAETRQPRIWTRSRPVGDGAAAGSPRR